MITVWGRRNSVNVQKVLWTVHELGIGYRRESVGGSFGGNRDADFLAMNPMGLVPVIRDGDVTMFESNAIVRYLSARYGGGAMRPEEHHQLAMAEQWMEWQQNAFAPAVGVLFLNGVRLPADKRNAAAFAEAELKAIEALRIADDHLSRHDWFAGAQFSFGDIVMGCFLWRYMGIECRKPDMPHLEEWLEALEEREAFHDTVMAVPRAKDAADWDRIEKEVG